MDKKYVMKKINYSSLLSFDRYSLKLGAGQE